MTSFQKMAFELDLKDAKGSERRKEGYPGGRNSSSRKP